MSGKHKNSRKRLLLQARGLFYDIRKCLQVGWQYHPPDRNWRSR